MTHGREITEPVDLCRPDGRLNPAAVGWSRRPLHRANLRGWGRAKRWEHWGVVTPAHIVGLVASSLDYAGVHSLYLLDRRSGIERTTEAVVPFARGALLPPVSGAGAVRARGGGLVVEVDQRPEGSTIRAAAPRVEVDQVVPLPPGHDRVDVTFHPFHERVARTNLGVLAGETHQCFGHFSGWAATDDGERVDLDGLVGWAEEARNRW